MIVLAVAVAVRVAVFVAVVVTAKLRRGATQESGVLLLGMLRQAEPKLRHGQPMGLSFKRGRFLRQLEAALRPSPEFFGKFHYHPAACNRLRPDNPH